MIQQNPNILAIETATDYLSVACCNKHGYEEKIVYCPKQHSSQIKNLIKEVLVMSNLEIEELDAIAFSQGPGYFTSLRIGLAISQGLALGLNIPLIAVPTLRIIAQEAFVKTKQEKIIVCQNARNEKIYLGYYEICNGRWIAKEECSDLQSAKERIAKLPKDFVVVKSSCSIQDFKVKHLDIEFPNAKFMLPIAKDYYENNKTLKAKEATLLYLQCSNLFKKQ